MRIKNISPWGDLEVPLLGRVVEAGEIVDVTPEQAERLLPQDTLWQPTDKDAKALVKALTEPEPERADDVQPGVDEPDTTNEDAAPAVADDTKGEAR